MKLYKHFEVIKEVKTEVNGLEICDTGNGIIFLNNDGLKVSSPLLEKGRIICVISHHPSMGRSCFAYVQMVSEDFRINGWFEKNHAQDLYCVCRRNDGSLWISILLFRILE